MILTINQRYYLGATTVILTVLAAIVVAYPQLPNMVPVYWDLVPALYSLVFYKQLERRGELN
jgi:uncharacterized membrane protein